LWSSYEAVPGYQLVNSELLSWNYD
jgi:hypothetical protein